jgi:hypothetical protein
MAKSIDEVSRDAIRALLTQVAARLAISPFISYRATSREFARTDPSMTCAVDSKLGGPSSIIADPP